MLSPRTHRLQSKCANVTWLFYFTDYFLRIGCQDREYSFAEVFLFFPFDFFFKTRLKNQTGQDVLNFRYFCIFLTKKCFRVYFVKLIGLCQLLQLSTNFDEIFRIYSPKLNIRII